MKIRVTEIECTADELRQSNTVAEGALNLIRNLFNGTIPEDENEVEQQGEKEANNEEI